MITARTLAEKVEWLEQRWGTAGKAWDHWEALVDEFVDYDPADLQAVLDAWFTEGNKFPPRPAEVMAKLRGRTGSRAVLPPPDQCKHPEPFGFDETPEGRVCRCRLCGTEWVSGSVLTPLEGAELQGRPPAVVA